MRPRRLAGDDMNTCLDDPEVTVGFNEAPAFSRG